MKWAEGRWLTQDSRAIPDGGAHKRETTLFKCDLLVEDDEVIVVGDGDMEPLDFEWTLETIVEACGHAASHGIPVVLDLRHARLLADGGLDDWIAELDGLCADLGVRLWSRLPDDFASEAQPRERPLAGLLARSHQAAQSWLRSMTRRSRAAVHGHRTVH